MSDKYDEVAKRIWTSDVPINTKLLDWTATILREVFPDPSPGAPSGKPQRACDMQAYEVLHRLVEAEAKALRELLQECGNIARAALVNITI